MFVVDGLASTLASKASGDVHAKLSNSSIGSIGNPPYNKCNKWVPRAKYAWFDSLASILVSKASADIDAKPTTLNIGSFWNPII